MRILFMGTPDFASQSLKSLIDSRHEVVGVVTNPDKPKGRGHKLMKPPVKILAEENNLPVFQPSTLKNGEIKDVLEGLKPDCICVAAYGKILPPYVLEYPKYKCVNVHGSLLPKYRGAAPIQWAVINGEKYTGITTMLMGEGLDSGDILLTQKTEIQDGETAEHLFDRLAVIGGELLIKTLDGLENGEITPTPQNEAEATYVPMIKKEDALIDWSKSSKEICNLVCGMNSWPMAFTNYKDQTVKIITAVPSDEESSKEVGTIVRLIKKEGLMVSCTGGSVIIKEVQFAGSKRMNIEDYMRGHEIEIGSKFVS